MGAFVHRWMLWTGLGLIAGAAVALAPVRAAADPEDGQGEGEAEAEATPAATLDVGEHVDDARWRLYAVEYARSKDVSERRLVRGPSPSPVDMSWYFFVAVGHGRVVLVDCGTDRLADERRRALRDKWSIDRAIPVTEALARVGLEPGDVTDVVLTHAHWDHFGGLSHFDDARVHVHRGEWARIPPPLREPVQRDDRLHAITDTPRQLWQGLTVRESGHHTPHQLMVELACGDRRLIIAGDAAYLYRNIEEGRPVTQATSHARNVAAVERAVREVGAEHVVPGHDPAVFARHASGVEGVAALCD